MAIAESPATLQVSDRSHVANVQDANFDNRRFLLPAGVARARRVCGGASADGRLTSVAVSMDRGERWVSAESEPEEIATARMAKKQRMRWPPEDAYSVATVLAATRDPRLMPARDLAPAA